nr:MAG TPA: hypothetical protein [Caudoviricetes sp.]
MPFFFLCYSFIKIHTAKSFLYLYSYGFVFLEDLLYIRISFIFFISLIVT